ncbi:tRNA (adenosine(37)-N6)-threonylcarbamoyltransferase complex ATPase subunit type 1 TsaE [Olivibacter sp. XZL3]|uniref:tRNA (adenosine(37)-N6)-threonylcarbamoyltransferase complex ATPase subunit type 1 TsaE n=1 Tax=Olivibacter sp. XZL3 TaxID=1735116 RepID=UPI0010664788|nr:tRNA (adenosine(37)-N6)-threonylcarbamoyltransferase complex ATPase subunit type 1 TsaE [Olivibacter sp. XZL3]
MIITVDDMHELPEAARKILQFIADYRVVLFFAPMGAGKTTLIKELCRQLQVVDQVASPTFSIVNEYSSPDGNVFHFDFYRLKEEQEALDLGYEEYFYSGNYCFIEWPEKIPNLLPEEVISLTMTLGENAERNITVQKGLPESYFPAY